METITVRRARQGDLVYCVPLCYALQTETYFHDQPHPPAETVMAWLDQMSCLLVAHTESMLVGLCGGSIITSPLFPQSPVLHEAVFYVRPAYQHQGIGRALLLEFMESGRLHGAKAMLTGHQQRRGHRHGERTIWTTLIHSDIRDQHDVGKESLHA